MMTPFSVSVVIPAYNEEVMISKALEKISKVFDQVDCVLELIVINDGSTDNTQKNLKQLVSEYDNLIVGNFSRNFGKEAALLAGLELSSGDCIVFIDADLQHPPEVIPKMINKWIAGYDIVNAKKTNRGKESFFYKIASKTFNYIISKSIGSDFEGASDFKLIDRQVANVICSLPEKNRFFRGLTAWAGFEVCDIGFEVAERLHGETKWSKLALISYTLTNIFSFSSFPLKMVAYIGFLTAGLGFLLLLQTLYNYIFADAVIGFTTVIAVQVLLGGMILLSLGVVSIYMGKIYEEQKSRPVYILRKDKPRGRDLEVVRPAQAKSELYY
ncbi:MAG: glycosyltransferase involved in cell wall biosynthesis [Motiliproteus sp.]|jgi:glycosyltransferase involved in cell wall biosynthesis